MVIWKWKGIHIMHLRGMCTLIGTGGSFIEIIHDRNDGYGIAFCLFGHTLEFKVKYLNLNKRQK